jgi:subtilase family serine protease
MRIRSIATGAVLCALPMLALLPRGAPAAMHVEPQTLGLADQNAVAHFNVYLPLTHTDALEKLLQAQTDSTSPNFHHWLTPAQFKQQFGPNPADVARTKSLLQSEGFTIVSEKTQSLEVEGSVANAEKIFGTRLNRVQMPKGSVGLAAAQGHLTMPPALVSMGAVIPEFTTHLRAHVHSKVLRRLTDEEAAPAFRLSSNSSFFYANDLSEAYTFPSFLTQAKPFFSHHREQIVGLGAHIGIVISSMIDPADLAKTFNSTLPLSGGVSLIQAYSKNTDLPVPIVKYRHVEGGAAPFDPNTADGAEASLDTQMSLGTAPGAKEIVYDMPELSDDFITAAYTAVVEDNMVDIVSSSFGECELDFTPAYNGGVDFTGILKTFHALFQQGNAQGITFLASSGDNGGVPCLSAEFVNNPTQNSNFVRGVENPASDPNVTGVGGTNLKTTATPGVDDATYASENANFDPLLPVIDFIAPQTVVFVENNTWGSGGGFSSIFAKPLYQFLVDTGSNKHRAVPDVSLQMGGCPGDADLAAQDCTVLPRSATIVWIGGVASLLIGTSSSSPEMAGVLALAVQLNGGRLGNVNPRIYALSAIQSLFGGEHAPKPLQFFHRNISGDNNAFKVRPGQAYSEVLGNGTLDVKNFLGLHEAKPAGAPDTPSNP